MSTLRFGLTGRIMRRGRPRDPQTRPPTLGQRVRTFAAAAATEGLAMATQQAARSPEEAARYHAICQTCAWYEPKTDQCAKCGCRMARKTNWRTTSCPIGRWPQ